MRERILMLAPLVLGELAAQAQPAELLQGVSDDQARRLEEYNRVFLQETLYSAGRHRIVSIDTQLLLHDDAITMTPFPDVPPLLVTAERIHRTDTYVNWFARIHVDDATLEPLGFKLYTSISMLWWDVNDRGDAELSGANRFKFSPAWRIDEGDRPILAPEGVARSGDIGPPPRTPEEIAEHKRLSKLRRHAFGSLSARLELPSGQTYMVTPLAYAPRFSVVFELDPDKVVPIPFEPEDEITAEQREKVARYNAFRNSLPVETKPIWGDVQ